MIVCVCHRVSDRDIQQAALAGCNSFDALQNDLRVARACGRCRDCAEATFDKACSGAAAAACRSAPTTRVWHVAAAA